MGLLDELKKLTKPYDDEYYLEEDLAEPVRAPGRAADARSYASYAESPRVQPTRRPYVFSNQRAARQQPAADPYAQQDYGYAPQGYAPQGYAPDPYARSGYAPDPYAQQGYAAPSRQPNGSAQPKLLLVHPDRFEQAADIADRIAERNAIVLNLETAPKELTRRMLDFLSGVTYALGGKVKKVSGSTYIITPAGMDFMGDSGDAVESREKYF